MNARQRFWLWAGALLIVGMIAVPPWVESFIGRTLRRDEPTGYAPIFSPPRPKDASNVVAIDTTRLLLQCGAVALLTGVMVVTNGGPARRV